MKTQNTTTATIATPSAALLTLARIKAATLHPHSQIRLTGGEHEHSYYIMNLAGVAYIGREADSLCSPFFKESEMKMTESNGKVTHYVQRLK